MKKDIHPAYFPEAKVTCACGNVFSVGSTLDKISVEICSACHPLYTGEEKIIDTAGRVEKFKARSAAASALAKARSLKKAVAGKRARAEQKRAEQKTKSENKKKKTA